MILILSHGRLAQEMVRTAGMIAGKTEEVYYFNFLKSMTYDDLCIKIGAFLKEKKNADTLVFTDLYGGSCFNACSSVIRRKNVRVFSGVNLGLLLEALFLRNSPDLDLEGLALALEKKKDTTIVYVNKEMAKKHKG